MQSFGSSGDGLRNRGSSGDGLRNRRTPFLDVTCLRSRSWFSVASVVPIASPVILRTVAPPTSVPCVSLPSQCARAPLPHLQPSGIVIVAPARSPSGTRAGTHQIQLCTHVAIEPASWTLEDLSSGNRVPQPVLAGSRLQGFYDGLAILGNYRQVGAGRCVGFSPSLFPLLQRPWVDAEFARELGL